MLVFKFAGMTLLVTTLAVTTVACESDDDASASRANAADKDADEKSGSGSEDKGKTVALQLTVWDLVEDESLADVKVCVYPKLTDCKTTDSEGAVTLLLPANSETGFLIDGTARDHTKVLVLHTTGDQDYEDEYSIASSATAKEFAESVGYKLDSEKAVIIGQTGNSDWSAGIEGVTLRLTPGAGFGPVYFNEDGVPEKSLKETTAGGSSALFAEVPPGDYTLTFSGKNCAVTKAGWKAEGDGAARVPAIAGTRTTVAVQCE